MLQHIGLKVKSPNGYTWLFGILDFCLPLFMVVVLKGHWVLTRVPAGLLTKHPKFTTQIMQYP